MEEEYSLELDDEPNQPGVDEDERYLQDEQETEDEAKRKAAEAEEARLQALVDRKLAQHFTKPPEPPQRAPRVEPTPAPYQPSLSEQEIIDKLSDEITGDLALDPKAAIKKVLTATRAMTTKSVEDSAARVNRAEVAAFRAARKDDPIFKAIKDDFDAEVDTYTEKQLGTATPSQLRRALELAEDSAIGRYYKKQLAEKRNRPVEPPRYSGGRSSGGQTVATRLTPGDKELIRLGKSAGLGDKEIRELIKESRK
jgi:hypothetical protein